jgi:predicted DNA-binding protein
MMSLHQQGGIMRRINIQITEEQDETLRYLSFKTRTPIAALIRQVLTKYLSKTTDPFIPIKEKKGKV